MLSDREIKIVKFLYKNQSKYVSSNTIGFNVGFSEKTIRNSINDICNKISKKIFEIDSVRGKGYRLIINNYNEYIDLIYKLKKGRGQICDKDGREKYILEILLLENCSVNFRKTSKMLFVSDSTLQRDIYNLNRKLRDYKLYLEKNKDDSLSIRGEEIDKRHFILDYFFSGRFSNSFLSNMDEVDIFDKDIIRQLLLILLDEVRNHKISVNDYTIENLVVHFALLIERIKRNCIINDCFELTYIDNKNIYNFSLDICERISKTFGIDLPVKEKNYIFIQLLSKTKSSILSVESNDDMRYIGLIKHISKKLKVDLLEDDVFLNSFLEHLASLEKRVESGFLVSNPLTDKIVSKYKVYLDLVKESFDKFLGWRDLTDDEWSYLVIYIISAIERNKVNNKLKILVVCASGFSTGLMLKTRISYEYSRTFRIVGVLGYYELSSENLIDIDLIISTIDLEGLLIPVPYVKVSVFLDEDDLNLIDRKIKEIRYEKSHSKSFFSEGYVKNNLFDKYFSQENFYINSRQISRNDALSLIYKSLSYEGKIQKMYKQETDLREKFGSVVFGDIISIPHPVHPIETKGKIFTIISSEDIFWDDLHKNVRIVFYISPPQGIDRDFEKVIAIFTKIIRNEQLIKQLIEIKDFEEFRKFMKLGGD